jgi:hypothetical protein
LVAHRAEHHVGVERRGLAAAHRGARGVESRLLDDQPAHLVGAQDLHRLQPEPHVDPPGAPRPCAGRPLAQHLDVAPHGWFLGDELCARFVELEVAVVHDHVGVGQLAKLAQLLGRELRLRWAAAPTMAMSSTALAASTSRTWSGMSVSRSSPVVFASSDDVDRYVPDSQHGDAAGVQDEPVEGASGCPLYQATKSVAE